MSIYPNLPYHKIIKALQRDGWIFVRQKGSYIRLQKRTEKGILKITVPAHLPVKSLTLRQILKQADMSLERFKELL